MYKALKMAASQLCIPYGADVLGEKQLSQALQNGSVQGLGLTKLQQELVYEFFSECHLLEILSCLKDSGATWNSLEQLYQESILHGAYPNKQLEASIQENCSYA